MLGNYARRLVHLAQDPAPEDVAIRVDVSGPGISRRTGFATDFVHGLPFQAQLARGEP